MRADVGAEIDHEPVAQGHDRAVAADADLDVVILLPRVVRRHQVLAPILDPLHRPAQAHRRPGHDEVLGIELAAHAEAAAHLELDEVDQVLGVAEHVGQDAPVEVRHLGHAPEREHARSGIVGGGEPARLHRHAGVALDGEALAEPPVGRGQRASALPARVTSRSMTLPPTAGCSTGVPGSRGAARVGDDGQGLPVDLDQLQRVLGEIAALGDHEGDGLAHVADPLSRSGGCRHAPAPARCPRRTGMRPTAPRSSAVITAATPGSARAASARMAAMRAWGWGERRTAAWSRPGRRTSAAYFPRPVRSRNPPCVAWADRMRVPSAVWASLAETG